MSQDIQAQLLQISNVLDDNNVKELVFLCKDLTAQDKEEIKDGNTLFVCLQKKGLISNDDLSFLKEIFSKIGRYDIVTGHLSMTRGKGPSRITSYRSLLYDISQELDSKDVKNIKFHLYPQRAKLQHTVSMLDILIEMERDGTLTKNNLETLKKTLAVIGRADLRQRILSYESQVSLDAAKEKIPIQETPETPTNQPKKTREGSGNVKELKQYNLDKTPHGWCVILNNEDFSKAKRKLGNRTGTERDAEAIRKVFERRNYIVEEHKNLTKEKMLNIMKEYQNKDHSNKDSFISFILSHGDQGTVFGVDGEEVLIKDLTSCVNGKNCPTLLGKPKVFFIQACQGDELDAGVTYEADCSTTTYESDGGSLPVTADFLIAYASSEGFVSLRGDLGSIFIQYLCKALEDPLNVQEDLKNILTTLQDNIADEDYKVDHKSVIQKGKQMPLYITQLRKQLILPPPGKMLSQSS